MAKTGSKTTASQRQLDLDHDFIRRMAGLIMMWANAESWLHRVLAVLLRTDPHRASLICSSFNSTRAKIKLVERMGIMCLPDARRVRHLHKLTAELKAVTKLRNRLCHSEYTLDSSETIVGGILSHNFGGSEFDGTNFNDYRRIDRGFLNEITQAHRKAVSLCSRFERFVKRAPPFVLERPRDTPLPLRKNRKKKGNRPPTGIPPKRKQPARPSRA
jgi:hypothetical protein